MAVTKKESDGGYNSIKYYASENMWPLQGKPGKSKQKGKCVVGQFLEFRNLM